MLNNIFVILFLLSLLFLVWGLISPKSLSTPKNKITRKDAGVGFGIIAFVLLILVGVTAPEPEQKTQLKQTQQPDKVDVQQNVEPKPSKEELAKLEEQKQRNYWHEVTSVIDGSTVKARVDGKIETIKVIGVDVPVTGKECFAAKSSEKAEEFLNGKWIQLEKDSSLKNRDKNGNLFRYVWFDEGTDFGRRLIEEGYAYENSKITSFDKQSQYKDTQNHSKSQDFGLWSPETCNGKKHKSKPKPKKPRQVQSQVSTPAPTPKPAPRPKPTPRPAHNNSSGVVKKSNSGICHSPGSTYYSRTIHFTPYNSLQACLGSGGRLPLR